MVEEGLLGVRIRGSRWLAEDREESARFEAETASTYECAGGVQFWWSGLTGRQHTLDSL